MHCGAGIYIFHLNPRGAGGNRILKFFGKIMMKGKKKKEKKERKNKKWGKREKKSKRGRIMTKSDT